jgi:subtilisin family serine protease
MPAANAPAAQATQAAAPGSELVKDRYIVVFHDDTRNVPALADRMVAEHGGAMHYRYQHALKGFAATLSPRAVEALRRNPNVKYVEPDGIVLPTTTQYSPPWGLDRVDQTTLPLSGSFTYGSTGLGVRVYVIDTGIQTWHPEFQGRASVGFDAMGDGYNGQDCHGHGTHVAGIVGAATYGVAKEASLVAVRVFNCSAAATSSSIVAGVDWVTANRVLPAVANMSLTRYNAGAYTALDDATRNLYNSGVTVVTGAAHTQVSGVGTTPGADACANSPARLPEAITVSASNPSDSRVINKYNGAVTWTANFGPCVDLFAPGDDILSTGLNGGTQVMGGTSQAAPHVAGFAARFLQGNPTATPASVTSYILGWGNPVVINAGPSTTTELMYTGAKRRAVG